MRTRIQAVVLAAVAALLLAPAVHADSHEGFFVDIDLALAAPGNVEAPLAANAAQPFSADNCSSPCNEVDVMDWDDEFAWGIGFGYGWGEKGAVRVSYWTFDSDTTQDGSALYYPGQNFMLVGPVFSFGYTQYYDLDWDFTQDIQASNIDVEYLRDKDMSENLMMTYGVGIRVTSYEDTTEGQYLSGGTYRFDATRRIDTDAFGFTGSFGVEYDFTDLFGIGTDLRVGFLTAEVDSEQSIVDVDAYYGVADATISEENTSEDEVATTLDFNFNLVFHTGDLIDVEVGWFYANYSEIAQFTGTKFAIGTDNSAFSGLEGSDDDRVTFSGPRANVKFKF